MKKLFICISILVLVSFYSCGGSGKVTVDELLNNPSFYPNEFFNSKISIYSPYVVLYSNQKYPNITKSELTDVVLKKSKEILSTISNNQNIIIENRTAPDFFRGIKIIKDEGEQLLKNSNSDYLLIIQSVIVGNETNVKTKNIDLSIPPPGVYDAKQKQNTVMDDKNSQKNTTQTTITYDIWDVKKGVSVYTAEAYVVLTDGINHKNPYLSIEKVTEGLINKIRGVED